MSAAVGAVDDEATVADAGSLNRYRYRHLSSQPPFLLQIEVAVLGCRIDVLS